MTENSDLEEARPVVDIKREMTEAGYHEGAPNMDAAALDGSVCAEASCPKCNRQGLQYLPYTKQTAYRKIYKAYAACPNCKIALEF